MVNSISSLIDGAESCGLEVWKDYCDASTKEKISKIQLLRDPLKNCSFRSEQVLAVFGFFLGENECSMVYFWDRHQQAAHWSRIDSVRETKSLLEFGLMIYFLFGMYSAIPLNDFGLFPFHFMLFLGFGFVFLKSVTSKV